MFLHRTHLGAVLPSSGRGKSNLFRDLFALLVIPAGAVSLASSGFVLSANANERNNETIGGFSSFLIPRGKSRMLNWMIRIALAAVLSMLGCFGRAAEPLKIGMVAPLTGPAAEVGRYQTQGAKLAAEEVNKAGGMLGRAIELVIEDSQSTNPGAVLAFSKLAGNKDIPAFIGPVFSTQIHAIAPDIQRIGKPVMIGGTDPQLTHMGNPWLFRFRPNDTYSARVIADYGVKTLDKKKWAIVHSTDAFGTSGMKNLVEDLKGMGVEPALVQGYTNNSQDFTPVVLAVKQSGADVMATYMTLPPDLAIFARQLRQLGVNIAWVGSPSAVATDALKLAGPALYGSYAVADFAADSSPAAKEFAAKYEANYKSAADLFGAWTYDAVHVLALAIDNAKSLEPQKIRDAILSVKDYPGVEGTYNFDQNGDGLHGYNVVKNDNGKIVFIKHVDFNE
jgi:branched-chain amino acid transport system substrate-binding protein